MLRRLSTMTALFGAAALLGTTAPALAATVIGQTGTTAGIGCGDATRIQTSVASSGASFVVPTGNWLLDSWSTQAGPDGGQMATVVLRPTGTGGQYTVVGITPTETLTPNALNTFSASIVVQTGDLLGLWASGGNCVLQTNNGGDGQAFAFGSAPTAGDTLGFNGYSGYVLDVSATISPISLGDGSPTHSMFVCYSKFEQDGGAVFGVAQAEELLAGGYWLPSAVSGTVQGGTNMGAYHLECNPPAGLRASGAYLGGGGDIVGASSPAASRTGYYPIVG